MGILKAVKTSRHATDEVSSTRRRLLGSIGILPLAMTFSPLARAFEQRNDVSFLRGPYQLAFYRSHSLAYRLGAGMHFFHSKQHDLLQRTPLSQHKEVDESFDQEALSVLRNPPKTEPEMDYYSTYVDQTMRTLFRTIDWTHMHHEQTYDILSDASIPWDRKRQWTDRAVRYYLTAQEAGIPRSPAPLDVTMRRAGLMMKPYFTYFRNYYPKDQSLFLVAHWWHPVVYEAMMISGNRNQEANVGKVIQTMWDEVIPRRPQRMLLSREGMPRYAQMSPESANIFDNLHMLHGIAYDILAYEGWSVEEKRAEMYRVIRAMGYQPGDEELARKFDLPDPNIDPRRYTESLASAEGGMSRIMMEMMEEMMPQMMPSGMSEQQRTRMMEQFRKKMMLGLVDGETDGSLHDAMHRLMPDMKMAPGSTEPGQTPHQMVETMLKGWEKKAATHPEVSNLDMSREPA
jgi:hypothetical protein